MTSQVAVCRAPILPLFFGLAFTLSKLLWLPHVLLRLAGNAPAWPCLTSLF